MNEPFLQDSFHIV